MRTARNTFSIYGLPLGSNPRIPHLLFASHPPGCAGIRIPERHAPLMQSLFGLLHALIIFSLLTLWLAACFPVPAGNALPAPPRLRPRNGDLFFTTAETVCYSRFHKYQIRARQDVCGNCKRKERMAHNCIRKKKRLVSNFIEKRGSRLYP